MMAGMARIAAAFDLPGFAASGSQLAGDALKWGGKAAVAFASGYQREAKNGEGMVETAMTQAMRRAFQNAERMAAISGQAVADNFLGGINAIRSGDPGQSFAAATNAMSSVIGVAGQAGQAITEVGEAMGKFGPIAEYLGNTIGGVTTAMQLFTDTGGEYLGTIAEIGDTYLQLRRTLAESTLDLGQVNAQMALTQEIMAGGAVDHFDDVSQSIGRFARGLNLAGPELRDFTETYAAMAELIGSISPTNIAGVLNAYMPDSEAERATYNYGEQLTRFTNIIRATGGNAQAMVDSMIRVGPAMRALGYDAGGTALFFGSLIEKGLRGQKLVYGMNQIVEKLHSGVQSKQFKDLEDGWSRLLNTVKALQAAGKEDSAIALLSDYTTPANAALLNEAIQKGVIYDAKEMAKRAGEGFGQSLSEAAAETSSLSDVFENIQQQFEAAVSPVGLAFNSFIIGGGNKLVAWLAENQLQVAEWAKNVADFFLKGFQALTSGFGNFLVGFSEVVNGLVEFVGVSVMRLLDPFRILFDTLGKFDWLPGNEMAKSIGDGLNAVNDAIGKTRDLDLSKPFREAGEWVVDLSGKLTKVRGAMGLSIQDYQRTLNVEQALKTPQYDKDGKPVLNALGKQDYKPVYAPMEQYEKDEKGEFKLGPDGQKIPVDIWQPMIQIMPGMGDRVKQQLRALNLEIALNATGTVITSVRALNEEARRAWEAWISTRTKTQLEVQPVPTDPRTGLPLDALSDTFPGGEVEVKVVPDTSALQAYAAQSGLPLPSTYGAPTGAGTLPSNVTRPAILSDQEGVASSPASIYAAAAVAQNFPEIKAIGGGRKSNTAPNTHDIGQAIDIAIPRKADGTFDMAVGDKINNYLRANAQALNIRYTIWRDTLLNTAGGPPQTIGNHMDHIDVQFNDGGVAQYRPGAPTAIIAPGSTPVPTLPPPGTYGAAPTAAPAAAAPAAAASGSKQEIANYIISKAMSLGYSRAQADMFLVQAVGESNLDPLANGGNQDGTGDVRGIFQFTPGTWGNRPGSMTNPQDNIDQYFALAAERGLTPQTFTSGTQLGTQVSIGGPYHPSNVVLGHLANALAAAAQYIAGYAGGAGTPPAAPALPAYPAAAPPAPAYYPPAPAVPVPVAPAPAPAPAPVAPPVAAPVAPPVAPAPAVPVPPAPVVPPVTPPAVSPKLPTLLPGQLTDPKTGKPYWPATGQPTAPLAAEALPVPLQPYSGGRPINDLPGLLDPDGLGASVPLPLSPQDPKGGPVNSLEDLINPGRAPLKIPVQPVDEEGYPVTGLSDIIDPRIPAEPDTLTAVDTGGPVAANPNSPLTTSDRQRQREEESGKFFSDEQTGTLKGWGEKFVAFDQYVTGYVNKLKLGAEGASTSGSNVYTESQSSGSSSTPANEAYPTVETPQKGFWESIGDIGRSVKSGLQRLAGLTPEMYGPDGKVLPSKYNTGGPVWGAGTATSDSIPAWLSNGEFVQNAAAVQHYGVDFMHALNARKLPKFEDGGEVPDLSDLELDIPHPLDDVRAGDNYLVSVIRTLLGTFNPPTKDRNGVDLTGGVVPYYPGMLPDLARDFFTQPDALNDQDVYHAYGTHSGAKTEVASGLLGKLGVTAFPQVGADTTEFNPGPTAPGYTPGIGGSGGPAWPDGYTQGARIGGLGGYALGGLVGLSDGGPADISTMPGFKDLQKQMLKDAFAGRGPSADKIAAADMAEWISLQGVVGSDLFRNSNAMPRYAPGGEVTGQEKLQKELLLAAFQGKGGDGAPSGGGALDYMGGKEGGWKEKLSKGVANVLSGSFWLEKAGVDTSTEGWNKKGIYIPGFSELTQVIGKAALGDITAEVDGRFSAKDIVDFLAMPDALKEANTIGSDQATGMEKGLSGLAMMAFVPGLGKIPGKVSDAARATRPGNLLEAIRQQPGFTPAKLSDETVEPLTALPDEVRERIVAATETMLGATGSRNFKGFSVSDRRPVQSPLKYTPDLPDYANFSSGTGLIDFNKFYFSDPDMMYELLSKDSLTNWSPRPGSLTPDEQVTIHELIHAMHSRDDFNPVNIEFALRNAFVDKIRPDLGLPRLERLSQTIATGGEPFPPAMEAAFRDWVNTDVYDYGKTKFRYPLLNYREPDLARAFNAVELPATMLEDVGANLFGARDSSLAIYSEFKASQGLTGLPDLEPYIPRADLAMPPGRPLRYQRSTLDVTQARKPSSEVWRPYGTGGPRPKPDTAFPPPRIEVTSPSPTAEQVRSLLGYDFKPRPDATFDELTPDQLAELTRMFGSAKLLTNRDASRLASDIWPYSQDFNPFDGMQQDAIRSYTNAELPFSDLTYAPDLLSSGYEQTLRNAEIIEALMSAIEQSPRVPAGGLMVTRATGDSWRQGMSATDTTGNRYLSPGFQSTSTGVGDVTPWFRETMQRIFLPEGTRALYVSTPNEGLPNLRDRMDYENSATMPGTNDAPGTLSTYPNQNELIIPPFTGLSVVGDRLFNSVDEYMEALADELGVAPDDPAVFTTRRSMLGSPGGGKLREVFMVADQPEVFPENWYRRLLNDGTIGAGDPSKRPGYPWTDPGGPFGTGNAVPPFATGGPVIGSGTGTSDSIPAWLSDGEFVQNAAAVGYYGTDFMHAVNSMKLPKFAPGGQVGDPPPLPGASNLVPANSRGLVGGDEPLPYELANFRGQYDSGPTSQFQAADNYNPFKGLPRMPYEDALKAIKAYVKWQEEKYEALVEQPKQLADDFAEFQAAYDEAFTAATNKRAELAAVVADEAAQIAAGGDPVVIGNRFRDLKATLEREGIVLDNKAQQEYDNLQGVIRANDKNRARQLELDVEGPPPIGDAKKSSVRSDKDAESLGAGLVKGVLQGFGFPDVFGDAITEWGIYQMGMGVLGYGMNLAQSVGALPGSQTPGVNSGLGPGSGAGIASGVWQTAVPGVKDIPGANVPEVTPSASVTPAMAAAPPPVGSPASGVGTGPLPGPGVQIQINNPRATEGELQNSINHSVARGAGNSANNPALTPAVP